MYSDHPVVCFDETSKQLVADKRPAIGAKPGRVERYDYEYKRNGTRNLFMSCEPMRGFRHVEVTERRTAVDFAHQMRWLVDEAQVAVQFVWRDDDAWARSLDLFAPGWIERH